MATHRPPGPSQSTRAQILAETLAWLEAERFAGPRRPELTPPRAHPPADPPPPRITPEQAQRNAAELMAAIDGVLLEPAERRSA